MNRMQQFVEALSDFIARPCAHPFCAIIKLHYICLFIGLFFLIECNVGFKKGRDFRLYSTVCKCSPRTFSSTVIGSKRRVQSYFIMCLLKNNVIMSFFL